MRLTKWLFSALILSALMIWGNGASAQISEGGLPPSFGFVGTESAVKAKSPVIINANFDVAHQIALDKQELAESMEAIPYKVGKLLPADLNIENAGEWITLADGTKIWTLSIKSPGALALMLYYDEFYIPKKGKLFIYNTDKTQVLGAYTSKTNPLNRKFATEFVAGDDITLEYVAPAAIEGQVPTKEDTPRIKISYIAYGYNYISINKSVRNQAEASTGFYGTSGWCEVNVNCPEGADWVDQKKGVASTVGPVTSQPGYVGFCSGTLVNNTAKDLTPYFLSAYHCYQEGGYLTMDQLVFYFHWETPGCLQSGDPNSAKTMVGAEILVKSSIAGGSDGELLRLNQNVPADYRVYYNGWDRSGNVPQSGVGIHHPNADVKKISTYTAPATNIRWNSTEGQGAPNAHWNVTWVETQSGKGLTEGGSSGSPLFNQDGRVVGTLTGGPNVANTPKCDQPLSTHVAYYGKLWYHWDQHADPASHMKTYLDPLNTGEVVLDGMYDSQSSAAYFLIDPSPASIYVFGTVKFINESYSAQTYEWTFEGGTPNASTDEQPPVITYNAPGNFTAKLIINKGTADESEYSEQIQVVEKGANPVAPVARFTLNKTGGGTAMTEGFDISMPPAGWVRETPGASANGFIRANMTTAALNFNLIDPSSTYSALVQWDANAVVDTWLKSPEYTVPANAYLEFWGLWSGEYITGGTLFVYISTDNGVNWDELWTNGPDNTDDIGLKWHNQFIALPQYYEGQDIRIGLRYAGQDGYFAGFDGLTLGSYLDPSQSVSIKVGEYVSPFNVSSGPPILYDWTFTGGTPEKSDQENPGKIQYLASGTYDISLKVKNYRGEDTHEFTGAVIVEAEPPVLAYDKSGGYANKDNWSLFIPTGAQVTFTDKSKNYPSSWEWNFGGGGDPDTSTEQNPTIAFNTDGEFDFSFKVANEADTKEFVHPKGIKVGYGRDTVWNMLYGETAQAIYSYTYGYITGTNSNAYTAYAEKFDAPAAPAVVTAVKIDILASGGNSSHQLAVSLAKVRADGFPGAAIATTTLRYADIKQNGPTLITLPEPVAINDAFYIIVGDPKETGGAFYSPGYTAAIKTAANRGAGGKNTGYAYNYLSYLLGYEDWFGLDELYTDFSTSLNVTPVLTYAIYDGINVDGKEVSKINFKNIDPAVTTVNVKTNLPWTATCNAPWIDIKNGANDGDGSFTFTVKNNEYNARKAIISVKSGYVSTVLVQQAGPNPIELTAVVADEAKGKIDLDWDHAIREPYKPGDNIFDDAEEHTAWEINSMGHYGWTYIDGDGQIPADVVGRGVLPNPNAPAAFRVFNPSKAALSVTYAPHSGEQYFATTYNRSGAANNDWMISPELKYSEDFKFSFWAKAYVSVYPERIKVAYSTTGNAQGDFTVISDGAYLTVPAAWTKYEYTIPANAKYVAINYVSRNAFMLMVDDIFIGLGDAPESVYENTNLIETGGSDWQPVKMAPRNAFHPSTRFTEAELNSLRETFRSLSSEVIKLTDESTGETFEVTKINRVIESSVPKLKLETKGLDKTPAVETENALNSENALPVIKLRYDDGTSVNAIGFSTTEDVQMEVAIRFTPEDLIKYQGAKMKAVDLYLANVPSDGIIIKIRQGDNVIHSQAATSLLAENWIRISLTKELSIDASKDLYVGYEFIQRNQEYVPSVSAGPAKPMKSDLISSEGEPFESLYDLTGGSLDYNWNIVLLIEDNSDVVDIAYNVYRDNVLVKTVKEMSYLDQIMITTACYEVTALYNGELESTPGNISCVTLTEAPKPDAVTDLTATIDAATNSDIDLLWTASIDAVKYKVYRNGELLNDNVVEAVYRDENLVPAEYCYTVIAINSLGTESDPSNEACATIVNTIVNVTGIRLDPAEIDLVVGRTAQLNAAILPDDATNQNINWTTANAKVATVSANGLVTAVSYGMTTITVSTEDGNHTATCIVNVYTSEQGHLKATEAFTPNGDMINDFFIIEHIEDYPSNELLIFDRSGTLHYSATGYQNNWDGTANKGQYNGSKVPSGTYYYILRVKDRGDIKGFVVIRY